MHKVENISWNEPPGGRTKVSVSQGLLQRAREAGCSIDEALAAGIDAMMGLNRYKVNVFARTVDLDTGETLEVARDHNIVVNIGRQWHRDLLAVTIFPADHTGDGGGSIACGDGYAYDQHRPRYIGVGTSGNKQTAVPPGPGVLYETVNAKGLEAPAKVDATYWMKQIDPQPVGDDSYYLDYKPSAFAIRFRTLFTSEEISFAAQPTFGTSVPVSEYGLFTSAANWTTEPAHGDGGTDITGFLAYCTAAPVTKTPSNGLEVIWEFRT